MTPSATEAAPDPVPAANSAPVPDPAPEVAPAIAAEATLPITAGYDKGFFIRGDEDLFELKIQARLQARYAYEAREAARDSSAFSIPRARLVLGGHLFTKDLTYKLQADFGRGFVTLKDFYADYRFFKDWLHVRAGQWKKPFSRQQITSSGTLDLVDRSITDRFFGAGRDIGVAVHNDYERSPTFEYALGLFNGTGDGSKLSGAVAVDLASGEGEISSGVFTNVPFRLHPALIARAGYNYGKVKGYTEPDLEGGGLRFGVAASAAMDFDIDGGGDGRVRGELDYILKVQGFSTTGAIYVSSLQEGDDMLSQRFEAVGFHLEAGYVILGVVQPMVRYALIARDGDAADLHEALAGVSVYFFEHNLKWQTDGGALLTGDGGDLQTDYVIRTQVQLAF